jgi:hypothetical protein
MVFAGTPDRLASSPIRTSAKLSLDLPARWKVHDVSVELTVLHVTDCPNLPMLRERLRDALTRLGGSTPVTVTERLVDSDEDARRWGFHGSPTILVDGIDRFPATAAPGLTCRLYRTQAGLEGAPEVDELVAVLSPLLGDE